MASTRRRHRRSPTASPTGIVGAIVGRRARTRPRSIRADAVASVAATFSFPMALALLVVLFLVVQPRLDDRDPKLRTAPRSQADLLVELRGGRVVTAAASPTVRAPTTPR